jgi:XTP/dITP diphosphohydrolase
MKLIAATRNKDKLREIKILLKGLPIKVFSLSDFKGVPKVGENGNTLEANAKKKALQVSCFLKRLAAADDSGIEIDALDGKPGVYSARFSGKGATYASNNEKVLKLLKNVPARKRKATFKCVVAIADNGKMVGLTEGTCRGRIIFEPRGKYGFGYDPIFIPDGYKETFAEMGIRKKNKISHRGKALFKAKEIIKRYVLTS